MNAKRLLAALLAGAAVLAAATACGGGSSRSSHGWHRCDGKFECETVSVPVSYSDPHGTQVPISVIKLEASGPHPIGDLVLNPGGPGGSGVNFLEQAWSEFPASLRARFTLVSFDPRGVGSSEPLQCLPSPDAIRRWIAVNPDPATAGQIASVVRAVKSFVQGCTAHASTAFVSSMSTANSARDMDRIRAALGQAKLTYLGFSYGTYLGTLYAELFPQRIRAMVLDGAIDPALGAYAVEAQQASGFEKNLHAFFAWCAQRASCRKQVSPASFAALMARFKRGLVVSAHLRPDVGGTQPVDYGTALLGVASLLYTKNTWSVLARGIAGAERDDGTYLALGAYLYAGMNEDGSFSNILSANAATSCLDRPAPTAIGTFEEEAAHLASVAPVFGAAEAWGSLVCKYWPTRAVSKPAPAHAPGAPPILVVGSTDDPATPYAWAQALAHQLPHATLLTRRGPGHTGYDASSCIRNWADRYLETLKMPPSGTVCASD